MKKTKKKKFLWAGTAALALSLIGGATVAQASDEAYYFQFSIQPYQANSITPLRYRQTSSTNNKWKVGVYTSTEGNGSYYRFWLENSSGTNVSPAVTAYTGPAYSFVYETAYASANQTYVRLAAQNAVYTTDSPYITGGWDEETW